MRYFFVFIFLFLSFSCSHKGPHEVLYKAEEVISMQADSALLLLETIKPDYNLMTQKDKALFGLLYFQALNKNNKELMPVELIDYSIDYYSKSRDNKNLAYSYLYKAKFYKESVSPEYVELILNAYEKAQKVSNDESLLGLVYSELGFLSYYQKEYELAEDYYNLALACFTHINDTNKQASIYTAIGNILVEKENYADANIYFNKTVEYSTDNVTTSTALLSIGRNYYLSGQYDEAVSYILQSSEYPHLYPNKAYIQFLLADIYFDLSEYENSIKCANEALETATDYLIQRECYRILVNAQYNLDEQSDRVVYYLNKYQDYNDSISTRVIPKIVQVHDALLSKQMLNKANYFNILFGALCIIILCIGVCIIYFVRKRAKEKHKTAEEYKNLLNENRLQLKEDLKREIEEAKIKYQEQRKNIPVEERMNLEKQMYNDVLLLNNEQAFIKLMNRVLHQLPDKLKLQYPHLNYKEIAWCCLSCLDMTLQDIATLLEYTPSSIYKFKQRLAKKLDLNGAKELDQLLEDFLNE